MAAGIPFVNMCSGHNIDQCARDDLARGSNSVSYEFPIATMEIPIAR
jgi:hypothetical protein